MRTVDPDKYEAKRKMILAAAALVFAERGYEGATTAAICREAGIGSGTLFHYFPDKRSLMLTMFSDDIIANAAFLHELDRRDPREAAWRVMDRMAAEMASPLAAGMIAAAMQLALRDEQFAALIAAGDQQMRVVLAELVTAGQSAGAFDAGLDPERTARWIQGMVDAGYFMTDAETFDAAVDRTELDRILARYLGDSERA